MFHKHLIVAAFAATAFSCSFKAQPEAVPPIGYFGGETVEAVRVVVRSSELDLRVKDIAILKTQVEDIVFEVKGHIDNWSLFDDRHLRMTLRVPQTQLDQTMDRVSMLGKVKRRSLSSQDVTEQLIDLEARLRNLIALRERLRNYLKQASDLKEILEVEKELARVQTEIEQIEARLKSLKTRIAMSTFILTARRQGLF